MNLHGSNEAHIYTAPTKAIYRPPTKAKNWKNSPQIYTAPTKGLINIKYLNIFFVELWKSYYGCGKHESPNPELLQVATFNGIVENNNILKRSVKSPPPVKGSVNMNPQNLTDHTSRRITINLKNWKTDIN